MLLRHLLSHVPQVHPVNTWNCLSITIALSLMRQLAMSAQKRLRSEGSVNSLT